MLKMDPDLSGPVPAEAAKAKRLRRRSMPSNNTPRPDPRGLGHLFGQGVIFRDTNEAEKPKSTTRHGLGRARNQSTTRSLNSEELTPL